MSQISFVHAPRVCYEQTYGLRFPPLWAYTLAAHLPEGWRASVYDCGLVDAATIPSAEVFAFSGMNQDMDSILAAHTTLKSKYPRAIFILGGPITWSYEQAGLLGGLERFDHVFILDGERALPEFLRKLAAGRAGDVPKIVRGGQFPMSAAKAIDFDLAAPRTKDYFGGTIEVSRGCPFLCEFCDIRAVPGNNRARGKDPDLIVAEIDAYHKLGVRHLRLACDNFVGDIAWAGACVDAILEWTRRTGARMSFYSWATVNLAGLPGLMGKMRQAGFHTLYIGVETFNQASLRETMKLQNRNDANQMVRALRRIQSFGFIVAPGLIFGFDSDGADMFDRMIEGTVDAGLIAGDPTFLMALPGTPLYERLERGGRLVDERGPAAVPLRELKISKVESNIRYLQPPGFLVDGFIDFMGRFASPVVMYRRFSRYVEIVAQGGNLVPGNPDGYGDLTEYLGFQFSSGANFFMLCRRLACVLRPDNLLAVLGGWLLVLRYRRRLPMLKNAFYFWVFTWSNLLLKHEALGPGDFKIHSATDEAPEAPAATGRRAVTSPMGLPNPAAEVL